MNEKKQALKRFREIPIASIKTGVQQISQKTSYTAKEAKCNHFSKVFLYSKKNQKISTGRLMK